MNDKEPIASPDDSRKTVANSSERTIATPHFDHTALRQARPAIPINANRGNRFWPTALIAVALLAGLAGGVIGAFIATGYLSRSGTAEAPASNDAPVNTEFIEREVTPSAENAPQQTVPDQISEAAQQPHSTTHQDQTLAPATKDNDEVHDSSGAIPAEQPDAALRAALNEWVAATNTRDLNKQMGFYNQKVNAFYQARDVNQDIVRADKARAFERAHSINVRASIPQITLSPDGQTAIMRFRKHYSIAGGGEDRSGEVVQELRWRRVDGKWRIVSERDIKIVR